MKLIDKAAVENILRNLWQTDNGQNPEHRICYNKALQEVQCKLDTLEVKEETEWNEARIKPLFTSTFDGNKYSKVVLCKNKSGGYDIAQYVRLQTGYCGWFSGENEVTITHWKELQ